MFKSRNEWIAFIQNIVEPDEDCLDWERVECTLRTLLPETCGVDKIINLVDIWENQRDLGIFLKLLIGLDYDGPLTSNGVRQTTGRSLKTHLMNYNHAQYPEVWHEDVPDGKNYLKLIQDSECVTLCLVDSSGKLKYNLMGIDSRKATIFSGDNIPEIEKAYVPYVKTGRLKI